MRNILPYALISLVSILSGATLAHFYEQRFSTHKANNPTLIPPHNAVETTKNEGNTATLASNVIQATEIKNILDNAGSLLEWKKEEFEKNQKAKNYEVAIINSQPELKTYISENAEHQIKNEVGTCTPKQYKIYFHQKDIESNKIIETDCETGKVDKNYSPYNITFNYKDNSALKISNLSHYIFMYETGSIARVTDVNNDGNPELWLNGDVCECDGMEEGDICDCGGEIAVEVSYSTAFYRGAANMLSSWYGIDETKSRWKISNEPLNNP